MADIDALNAAARAWIRQDPDPTTRSATEAMLGDEAQLTAHFGSRLSFGTAGLRGPIGPGPACMNLAVVRGIAHALGRWLGRGRVVIGFDARHGSEAFAAESASILGGMGFEVWLYDGICPTPELAYAVRALDAQAGVMVTASHNPPQDNGYKVYDQSGIQILPDTADAIADHWTETPHPPAGPPLSGLRASGAVRAVPDAVGAAWLAALLELRAHPDAGQTPLTIVYTAMHGVGTARMQDILALGGHRTVHLVAEQCAPDGDFPTVSFPNPEEPGAMDLAMDTANRVGAELVIANDPDADRLAVAVPAPGGWRMLSGNEVGWLLAEDLLAARSPTDPPAMVATTVVSSGLLRKIAEHHGAAYAETLTGFKWIGQVAAAFEQTGGDFVLGYEESLGYLAGALTRDKDGIGAALLFADLAAACKRDGVSVLDRLAALHRRHGLHCGGAHSVRLTSADGIARIDAGMERLREHPPATLGGRRVLRIRDAIAGTDTNMATGAVQTLDLPSSNLLAWDLDGGRALARPSGTEPKFKLYYEVVMPAGAGDLGALQRDAAPILDAIRDDLIRGAGLA